MSTEYVTQPPIPYEEFLKTKTIEIQEPEKVVYNVPHKVCKCNGTYIYVFKDAKTGAAHFERWGINRAENFFPTLIAEFKVKVFDEYGLPFDN